MPVYSVLEVNRIAAQTTGQRKQASRTTVYSDWRRSVWACVCLTNKKKKNTPNKTKTKQETNFSFQIRVSFASQTYLSCVLERLGWEVKCFFVRAPRLSAESACWMCACICAVAQIFLERADRFCTLCNSPGKTSPAHPLTHSASGRGFAPPSSPFFTIKNTQLWFHVMVSLASTASSWYPGDAVSFFYWLPGW